MRSPSGIIAALMRRAQSPEVRPHLVLAAVSLAVYLALGVVTGRVAANGGTGWDGSTYAAMLFDFSASTPNTALRPLIVMVNRPVAFLTHNALTTFTWMNYVYVMLLSVALGLLFKRYNADLAARSVFMVNVFSSIAIAKMFAYYPVQVDLGAYAVLVLTIYAIVTGRRAAAALGCVAAGVAREFCIAAAFFGIHRDLRNRVPLRTIAATYAPALLTFAAWRHLVTVRFASKLTAPLTGAELFKNLELLTVPLFVAFFAYFLVTLLGGVSLLVFGRAPVAWDLIRREHEWITLTAAITGAAAMGNADIWRYLAYLLPVFTVLFAWCTREPESRRWRLRVAILITLATVVTQRPWQTIDARGYLIDWFPYYLKEGPYPIWPLWGWRFLYTVGLLWLMTMMSVSARVTPAPREQ